MCLWAYADRYAGCRIGALPCVSIVAFVTPVLPMSVFPRDMMSPKSNKSCRIFCCFCGVRCFKSIFSINVCRSAKGGGAGGVADKGVVIEIDGSGDRVSTLLITIKFDFSGDRVSILLLCLNGGCFIGD